MIRMLIALFLLPKPAMAWENCMAHNKVSTTEVATSEFKMTLQYCTTKQSDGTEIYTFISGKSLIGGEPHEISRSQMTLHRFPRNRCDYIKVALNKGDIYLAIGRYSENCKTREFGSWRMSKIGEVSVPSVFIKKGKRPVFSKAEQTWR